MAEDADEDDEEQEEVFAEDYDDNDDDEPPLPPFMKPAPPPTSAPAFVDRTKHIVSSYEVSSSCWWGMDNISKLLRIFKLIDPSWAVGTRQIILTYLISSTPAHIVVSIDEPFPRVIEEYHKLVMCF